MLNASLRRFYVIGLTQPGTELPISHTQGQRSTDWTTAPSDSLPYGAALCGKLTMTMQYLCHGMTIDVFST